MGANPKMIVRGRRVLDLNNDSVPKAGPVDVGLSTQTAEVIANER